MNEYISIGKIVATFGLEGELILQHSIGKKTSLKDVKAIFVEELKGSYIPWFVEKAKAKSEDEVLVKLEGLNTKEAGKKLTQKKVWLKVEDLKRVAGTASPLALLGYTLIDEGKVLGSVEEVIEQPHQLLLKVIVDTIEMLIPIHEETLDKIDHKRAEVHVTLPDGLLDIYR
jgi:16S rRNA processing protein RimM